MDDTPWHEGIVIPALLRHARATYGQAMRRALAEAGYDDNPANGLYIIGDLPLGRERGIPIGQLVRELRVTKQAAGQLVDTLVLRGYLDRASDPEDRRKLTVALTPRGQAAAAAQAVARERIDAELIAQVGERCVGQMRKALGALCAMSRAEDEASDH